MRRILTIVLLVAPAVQPARAQTPRGLGTSTVEATLERGRELHARMKPAQAMELYRSLVERYPEHPEVLTAAAGEALTLGILASEEEDARRWYEEAEEYARRALAVAPEDPDAHFWLASALGRRSLLEGPRDRIRLAEEIRDHARSALEADSSHAGAHHVLGMWHAETERVSGVSRFFAEHLLGGGIMGEASWEAALEHLRRAVELAPDILLYRLELARALLDRERSEEARTQLRDVLERPASNPVDPLVKQEAQELLKSIE